jgi:quercetin dioxygenase-like cupin family protein
MGMKRPTTLLTATLIGISAVAFAVLPSTAQNALPPIAVQELTAAEGVSVRGAFTDEVAAQIRLKLDGRRTDVLNLSDPSRVAVARLVVQPGAQFPWHTHHGPVVVNVVEGELVYVNANDCVERPYAAGTAFIDPGRGNVHTAYNRTASPTVLLATFLEAPASGPLTLTAGVQAPADCSVSVGPHVGH